MIVHPGSGLIFGVLPMKSPENNEVKLNALKLIINNYPNCDTFIHDVSC